MRILHISAECYPAAKAGGLGDVVGALPKYLSADGLPTAVIIPKYGRKWFAQQAWTEDYRGVVRLHNDYIPFSIQKAEGDPTGFLLYAVDIPGKFDRDGIYTQPNGQGYGDDVERWLAFQMAVLQWLNQFAQKPAVLHCHDHHTGLIPFMVKHCPQYGSLAATPTVFTIHNGEYHGAFGWDRFYLLPPFDYAARGLLDWNNTINPLAAGIKNCWRFTTVSPSYLEELSRESNGLEWLVGHEWHKAVGIVNGIDAQVWDPKTDPYLAAQLKGNAVKKFKQANRDSLRERYTFQEDLPIFTFIGRLVREKGADLLPDLIARFLHSGQPANFLILGTGQAHLHHALQGLAHQFPGRVSVALEYNEGLAHRLYAGSDFLLMPSRVEPCGLNQLYAMRYGTVPVVRSVGGLRDTVPDVGEPDGTGRGFRFDRFSLDDAYTALYRAVQLYQDPKQLAAVRKRIMALDSSWEAAALTYRNIYEEVMSVGAPAAE